MELNGVANPWVVSTTAIRPTNATKDSFMMMMMMMMMMMNIYYFG
jgi:hypothetical protein